MRRIIRSRPDRCAIGLDIGGTKIAGGIVTADGHRIERLAPVPTPAADADATLAAVYSTVEHLRQRRRVTAVGIGVAGLVDWPDGFVRWAPNNAYHALPLRELVQQRTGLPTVVDNDANVAGFAEARLGTRALHMAFVAVGTGIGGGLVLRGHIYRGHTGIGGEIGHITVDPNSDTRCGCGNYGCLEALASGTAIGRYGSEAARRDPVGLIARLAGRPEDVTGETVLSAARAGDPMAMSIFQRTGEFLGMGLANLLTVLDVEAIVVGGGVAAAGELLLGPARSTLNERAFARSHRRLPDVVLAQLGADAGWVGAGLLALAPDDDALGRRRPYGRTATAVAVRPT